MSMQPHPGLVHAARLNRGIGVKSGLPSCTCCTTRRAQPEGGCLAPCEAGLQSFDYLAQISSASG